MVWSLRDILGLKKVPEATRKRPFDSPRIPEAKSLR